MVGGGATIALGQARGKLYELENADAIRQLWLTFPDTGLPYCRPLLNRIEFERDVVSNCITKS
jgi:hypothetical protein